MDRHLIENTLVPHKMFEVATSRIRQCFEQALNSSEPICLALIGESRTGKTRVIEEFRSQHPQIRESDGLTTPILSIKTPSKPTVKGVVGLMLKGMGDPLFDSGTEISKTERLKRLLRACGTRMIVLDEFQHFIDKGSQAVSYHVADWLKVLVDESNVALVVSGLPSSLAVIKQNEQLEGRFLSPVEMQRFDWSDLGQRAEFAAITGAFSESINTYLDTPPLDDPEMAFRLYCASGGLIGYLTKLLRQLIWTVIDEHKKSINLKDLDAAHALSVSWPKDISRPFGKEFVSLCDDATLARIYQAIGASQISPSVKKRQTKQQVTGYNEIFRTK